VVNILNGILKGLFEWLYGLFLDLVAYSANALLGVMSTDLTFFEENVPIVSSMVDVFIAIGWALLLGNFVFQAMKSMLSGIGFEAENPATLFARTLIFGFLLLGSRAICNIGLGLSKNMIDLLGVPTEVTLTTPDVNVFVAAGDVSWLLVIIIGVVLSFQLIKLFFEIGERYVIVAILTFMAPLGFAMGGSKSTKEIFTGYIRMYASMLLMMVMNVVFLKMMLSALATMPTGVLILPWCILVVAIARVARKIDNIISKIGLNPAITGDPLGRGAGMATYMAARMVMNSVSKSKASSKGGTKGGSGGSYRSSSSVANAGAMSSAASSFNGNSQNIGPTSNSSNSGQTNANSSANTKSTQNTAANQQNLSGTSANSQANQTSRFGSNTNAQKINNNISGGGSSVQSGQKNIIGGNNIAATDKNGTGSSSKGSGSKVNTNRFGSTSRAANMSKSQAGINPVQNVKFGADKAVSVSANNRKAAGTSSAPIQTSTPAKAPAPAKATTSANRGNITGASAPTKEPATDKRAARSKASQTGKSAKSTSSNTTRKSTAPSANKTRGIQQNGQIQKQAGTKPYTGTTPALPKNSMPAGRPPKNTNNKNVSAPTTKETAANDTKAGKKPVNIDIEVDDDG